VTSTAFVHAKPSGTIYPAILLEFFGAAALALPPEQADRVVLGGLASRGWRPADELFDDSTDHWSSATSVAVRVWRSGQMTLTSGEELLYDGPSSPPMVWRGLVANASEIPVLAAAGLDHGLPLQSMLRLGAESGRVLVAAGAVTLLDKGEGRPRPA
jgi:hypothetical protein